jgi:hypothetical protein
LLDDCAAPLATGAARDEQHYQASGGEADHRRSGEPMWTTPVRWLALIMKQRQPRDRA